MATANNQETRITQAAAQLLDCFNAELDEVVYEVAEQCARERANVAPLRIESIDVERAIAKLKDIIKGQVAIRALPEEAITAMENSESCVQEKLQMNRETNR